MKWLLHTRNDLSKTINKTDQRTHSVCATCMVMAMNMMRENMQEDERAACMGSVKAISVEKQYTGSELRWEKPTQSAGLFYHLRGCRWGWEWEWNEMMYLL